MSLVGRRELSILNGLHSLQEVMTDPRIRSGDDAARTLAAIVESSDDAIIAKDLDGTILSWNRGAELMYGYAAAEIIGRPIYVIVPPPYVTELSEILDRSGPASACEISKPSG